MAQPQERQPKETTLACLTLGLPLALLVAIWLVHIPIQRWLRLRLLPLLEAHRLFQL
jgi:hypothetical protein